MERQTQSSPNEPAEMEATGKPLPTLRRKSLSDTTLDLIRTAIYDGDLLPGQRLIEQNLAAQLDVSRGPVRDALRELEREGLIVSRPNRGTYVARLRQSDLREVYSLRQVLEQLAVRLACENATPKDKEELKGIVEKMKRAVKEGLSVKGCAELDLTFHDAIYGASQHKRLQSFWEILRPQVKVFLLERLVELENYREILVPFHKRLCDAVCKGDSDRALTLIREHIDDAYEPVARRSSEDDDELAGD